MKFSVGQILREINLGEVNIYYKVTQIWRVKRFVYFWGAPKIDIFNCEKFGFKLVKIKFWNLEINWKWNFGPSCLAKTAILTILEALHFEIGNF